MSIARMWRSARACSALHLRLIPLLAWPLKSSTILSSCLHEQARTVLDRCVKGCLWTLNTVLRSLLPLRTAFLEELAAARAAMGISLATSPSN